MGNVQSQVLQVWFPTGSQAVDQVVYPSQAFGLCARAAELLIKVHTCPWFHVWAPRSKDLDWPGLVRNPINCLATRRQPSLKHWGLNTSHIAPAHRALQGLLAL